MYQQALCRLRAFGEFAVRAQSGLAAHIKSLKYHWYDVIRFCLFLVMLAILGASLVYFFNREAIFARRLPAAASYDLSLSAIPLAAPEQNAPILRIIEKKHIFTAPAEVPLAPSADESLKLQKELARLRLVGVVADSPRQAMIEHRDSHQTFYLSEGETFLGGIRVDKIERGIVLLDIYGQTFELYL